MIQKWFKYLSRQKPEYMLDLIPIKFKADVIIVIPCYNEPDVIDTLVNIGKCERPDVNILIVVVINSGINTGEAVVSQNRDTLKEVNSFAENNISESNLFVYPLLFEKLPKKHAGVGLARKIGMDLAIDHFYNTGNEKGIIVSLDADCEVSPNFLTSIYNAFLHNDRLNATIQSFYHRVENNSVDVEYAVRQYEIYLHYYSDSLKKIGFPYYFHTIGSAFAVTADAYVRVGGMGRQQGGEDFYFLQKIFALGGVKELKDTFVFPLARFSDRVPFGTGPAIQKILDEPDKVLKVYSRQSFNELKKFFDLKESFFKKDDNYIISHVSELHSILIDFLNEDKYLESLKDCNENCATLKSFVKRFFHHFNAFMIVKYLNYVHPQPFELEKITLYRDKLQSDI